MKVLLLRLLGTSFLLLILAGLCFSIFQNHNAVDHTRTVEPQVDTVDAAKTTSTAVRERNDVYYAAITDRPVFEITRRPIVEEKIEPTPEAAIEVTVETPKPSLPDVKLLGVMSDGAIPRVLISVDEGLPVWLSEGEKIGGWTITEAGPNWLNISAGDNQIRLEIFE